MKVVVFISALIIAVCVGACSDSDSGVHPVKETSGRVVAHVFWDGQGLPDMRVELVELGLELKTDADGLAEFTVPTGTYTLRAYDINRGGPGMPYIDMDVTVKADETTRVEIANCLPCV